MIARKTRHILRPGYEAQNCEVTKFCFFLAYLTASGGGIQHWIGLNDIDSMGSYMWSDHTPVSFLNWADGGIKIFLPN